jgi:AcrR family transcriptional regulator
MVWTPWGDSETLRDRKLHPGPGTPRLLVRENQRERLMAAFVAACADRGYEATRVADLLEISGVSRKAFYEVFADKQACFMATLEDLLERGEARIASPAAEGGLEKQGEQVLLALMEPLAEQGAAARLCIVEAYAAGEEAVDRLDRGFASFVALARRQLSDLVVGRALPEALLEALVGGLRHIIHTRLHRGDEQELPGLVPDLIALAGSYSPPPRTLRKPRYSPVQAPGPDRRDGSPADRLLQAATSEIARNGYAATTIEDIVRTAGVSFSTFYEHFENKEDVFGAALYGGRARMLASTLPAYRRARSWPDAIRLVTETTLGYMEAEPDFARLVAVDVYTAGDQALARRDEAIESTQGFIDRGVEEFAPDMSPIQREAITSMLYAILCDRVRARGTENLRDLAPLANYVALCPFLGPEAACDIANGGTGKAAAQVRSGRSG